ncbi:MAG: FkbM family methyltransferase [Methylomarinum sp.]|nr:FkbM family methyltransferase [Methylomarinum sp.]
MKITNQIIQFVKKIPGIQQLYNFIFKNTPGSWIFTKQNLSWLFIPSNYKSLPFNYKIFSIFCHYTLKNNNKFIGSEVIHYLLSSFTRVCNLKNYCSIDINSYTVFLSLTDPRSLIVPNEIENGREIALLHDFLEPGDTFVDIGANHGSFSIVASKIVGQNGLVMAIEPQPILANLIEKSLSTNAYSPFKVFQVACSDKNGTEKFYIPKSTSGSAGVFKGFSAISATEEITVELIKFDNLVSNYSLTGNLFFKLDIEGSELNFLKGASKGIKMKQPKIMIEINPRSMNAAGTTSNDLITLLNELGYSNYREIKNSTVNSLNTLNFSRQQNIIILPKKT